MPQLTLYRVDGASSLAPHVLLRDLSIPFNVVLMKDGEGGYEAADGSFSNAEYRNRVNANGYVPILQVDDYTISEMPAILSFLATLVPDRQLGGQSLMERIKVLEWLAWSASQVHGLGFMMLLHAERFTKDRDLSPKINERGKQIVEASFAQIEKRLSSHAHPCGEAETVVDFNLLLFWYWGKDAGIANVERYPGFGRLIRGLEERESVRSALSLEGFDLSFPSMV
jgi:glutathione S-transferase